MNRTEARILRVATKQVAHRNKYLWWELKRQVLDFGYQSYYPRQSEYEISAKRAVSRLSEQSLQELQLVYSAKFTNEPNPGHEYLIDYYAALMVEEIVRRAEIAAYRTENW